MEDTYMRDETSQDKIPTTIPEITKHICAQLDEINARVHNINRALLRQQETMLDMLKREQRR